MGFFCVCLCAIFVVSGERNALKKQRIKFCSVFRGHYLSFMGCLCWRMWEESTLCSAVSPSFLRQWWALSLGLHNVTTPNRMALGMEGSLIALMWSGQHSWALILPLVKEGSLVAWLKETTENFAHHQHLCCSQLQPSGEWFFLPFHDHKCSFEKRNKIKCFRNRGLLKWI